MSILTKEEELARWSESQFRSGLRGILAGLGLDPDSDALADTPDRVLRALREMTSGYQADVAAILSRTFQMDHSGDMIIVRDVPFVSTCAHHLMPFSGVASVGYLPTPGSRVVGLSKLARTLDVFAKRLTSQEEVAASVTRALDEHLQTDGSACVLVATHGCLSHRGASKPGARMITSSLTGSFRDDPRTRQEFLALAVS